MIPTLSIEKTMKKSEPITGIAADQYFAILTAHPLVGIFGSTYLIVFGAFLFLVPFLMKKPIWSIKMANWNFILIAAGTLILWLSGFISHYAPLYTLYWPLPADFTQFNPVGGAFFILLFGGDSGGGDGCSADSSGRGLRNE